MSKTSVQTRWSKAEALAWHHRQPWLLGFNYVPSTAVNSTEFWQASSFDRTCIGRELAWAAAAGFNSCRVFMQEVVWEADASGLRSRFAEFLDAAAGNGLSVMPVLFDDCAFNRQPPQLGPQPEPIPGRMMTGWTASPGHARVLDRNAWPALQRYVTEFVGAFAADPRVVAWDLYNEPGNEGMGGKNLPLLAATFAWARAARPVQPLTVGIWNHGDPAFAGMNELQLCCSDVISFHLYGDLQSTGETLDRLAGQGRPVICTEWMARPLNSRMVTHLPLFRDRRAGCYVWGLVNGRTQTHIPWENLIGKLGTAEWFHDLFRADGTPYDPAEIALLRRLSPRRPAGSVLKSA